MSEVCGLFGKTRQGWYKQQATVDVEVLEQAIILKHVQELRSNMPHIGVRKLHYLLQPLLMQHNIEIGRDKLFDILADYGLLVRRRKRKKLFTTDSRHPFKKYPNLVKELELSRPDHVWVSDITYISLREKYCYLSLVTDAYSRKIIGYCLWASLKKEGPLNALSMALSNRESKENLIHHSDRGLQYCCADYINKLNGSHIAVSMTEKGDPYENALAERINGILKMEFDLGKKFDNFQQASMAVDNAIRVYNNIRPHASINYLTPLQAHHHQGQIPARWKSKKQRVKEWTNKELTD
ncbi:MAG: IS3 family transposase [Flavisolibacter sp.]